MEPVIVRTSYGELKHDSKRCRRFAGKQPTGVSLYRTSRRMLLGGKWRPPGYLMQRWHYTPLERVIVGGQLFASEYLGTWDSQSRLWSLESNGCTLRKPCARADHAPKDPHSLFYHPV